MAGSERNALVAAGAHGPTLYGAWIVGSYPNQLLLSTVQYRTLPVALLLRDTATMAR